MKNHTLHLFKTFTRFAVAALIAFTLLTTISCNDDSITDISEKPSWTWFGNKDEQIEQREQRIATLEQQIVSVESRLDVPEENIRRVALWQGVAAAFAVLSTIALVGGAALGSRARRMARLNSDQAENLSPDNHPA